MFYGVKSIIGPDCVLHPDSFMEEIGYLDDNGFDSSLVKVSPKCHIVTNKHIQYDKENLSESLGTTSKGIAPCYADKSARVGILAKNVLDDKYIWDESLEGNILCEGAQGFWLDINMGTYPFVTSSHCTVGSALLNGVPPKCIRDVWGVAKVYETYVGAKAFEGIDPVFDKIRELGEEFGATTGRARQINWLDFDLLSKAININGVSHLVFNKADILESLERWVLFSGIHQFEFNSKEDMEMWLTGKSKELNENIEIFFSGDKERI